MQKHSALLAVALVFGVFSASADDIVTVNGTEFHCQNTCEVTTSGGITTVNDSLGGWIHKHLPGMQ